MCVTEEDNSAIRKRETTKVELNELKITEENEANQLIQLSLLGPFVSTFRIRTHVIQSHVFFRLS